MSSAEKKSKVAIIWTHIPQYRHGFYEELRNKLHMAGIELVLIYGQPSPQHALKNDSIDLPWGRKVQNTYFHFGRWEFCWQPILPLIEDADLVIVEMANKLLVNYILLLQNALGRKRVAFWGHGRNFQAKKADRFSEWMKRALSTKVHWWFAYTDLSAGIISKLGFPETNITVVQNAINTAELETELEALNRTRIEQARRELGITGTHVGLYVGGMYPEKRLRFLLDSLVHIREQIPDFEMIFIGSGIDAPLIREMSSKCSWVHYVGPKFNLEKVPYFAISHLFLMPGLVGLAVLDCFALRVPIVTMRNSLHSPEIEYLESGHNGIIADSSDDPKTFAEAVVNLLKCEEERLKLVEGCRASTSKYSIENMAENFGRGIQLALNH
jgi:glycosyltransferase involved in cell wall biosynthesis